LNRDSEKRVAAQKAEVNFFALLKEHQAEIKQGSTWKEVPSFPFSAVQIAYGVARYRQKDRCLVIVAMMQSHRHLCEKSSSTRL
jgi:hypothetical protein